MMILVANLRLSGFFAVAGGWIMRRAHRPLTAGEGGDNRGQAAVADTPRTQRAGLCRDRLVVAVMFAGLFIIVTGADSSLLGGGVIAAAGRLQLDRLPVLSALTAILAN